MKELRLLQVLPSLKSGGVEQGTIDVANYIADKGFQSFVVSSGGRMLTQFNRSDVQHITLPVHSKNPLVIFQNIKRIKNIILKNKINLLHVRSRAPAWSAHYASKNICSSISTFHNVYGHQNLFKRFYNKGLSKLDNIVANSEYVKNSISNIYKINKKKITVIHRGIDTDLFNPEINDERKFSIFISKYQLPDNKKIILYPGRLTQWKGQIEFIDILQSLNLNNIVCYFVGDDKNTSYKLKLEKEIYNRNLNSNCKIIGHLSKEDMRLMYKCANLVISAPNQPEGFGRVISEGLAMKKILLCYNFGGSKEQILGLDDLYAVEPYNKKQMLERINIALDLSDNKRIQLGEIARLHVQKKFSKHIMLKNYYEFYKKIIL